jgi:hypothetical protein
MTSTGRSSGAVSSEGHRRSCQQSHRAEEQVEEGKGREADNEAEATQEREQESEEGLAADVTDV